MSDIVERLQRQADEIIEQRIAGWANTSLDAISEIESLRQQLASANQLLAESQRKVKALEEAAETFSTALDAAIAKAKREGGVEALMDAAKMMRIYQYFKFSDELIRMADELKGGEQ